MKNKQKIIDAHIHWWDLENNYYPWLSDNKAEEGGLSVAESLAQTYLQDDYFKDAENYEIIGVVHVQAEWDPSDPVGETKWLQGLADAPGKYSGLPQVIVSAANFAEPAEKVEKLLAGHCEFKNTRAIRHMLNYLADTPALCWTPEDYLANPTWLKNFSLLKKYNLGFDLMCFDVQMKKMAELAKQNPDIPIFLEHAGMPYQHDDEGHKRWKEGLKALAANDNTYAKISGFANTMDHWMGDKVREYTLTVIDVFGVDRVCFASNFPTDKQFSSMDTIWSAFLDATKDFSQDERDKMFMKNVIKMYDMKI